MKWIGFIIAIQFATLGFAIQAPSADDVASEAAEAAKAVEPKVTVAEKVDVDPINSDDQIAARLQEILVATKWFDDPDVEVDRGVVTLSGTADSAIHQGWAESTTMRTADVVAVVNRITVADKPLWNFDPAFQSLRQLGRETTAMLPLAVMALVIATIGYYLARLAAWITRRTVRRRVDNTLLQQVFANVVAVLIFIIGIYIALRVSGLTRLAVTLLGGTGLVGLALGFAFRDIAENYLASILISLNNPFRVGDLIEVDGSKGYVRKVTTRGTILHTLKGNQIQIPNGTVYKNRILNFTATPLLRLDFTVGIGFDDSITEAQGLIMQVFEKHVAVESDPPPLVLVQSLGSATVNLQGLYWIDQSQHSRLKVASSVIRQVKSTLTEAKITMPDEARELVFPQGVPVRMIDDSELDQKTLQEPSVEKEPVVAPEDHCDASSGEGDLSSEQGDVMKATDDDASIAGETNLLG